METTTSASKTRQGTNPAGAIMFLAAGALFGFLLSRAGASTYDYYANLFLFKDFQLLWVIAVAAALGVVGNLILRKIKARTWLDKTQLSFKGKPWSNTLIPGSLIFGIGWGLAGACPGTALVMLGEGKLGSLFTIAGFIAGTWIYGVAASKSPNTSNRR